MKYTNVPIKPHNKCPVLCPCICHDMGGGNPHQGESCSGKFIYVKQKAL